MFCVVQVIQRKKADPHGACRKYKVQSYTSSRGDGTDMKTYYYYEEDSEAGRFERPHKESYKISIHESRRKDGKVVKKQCVIGTVGYYDLIQSSLFIWEEFVEAGIERAAVMFGVTYEEIYQLVERKMRPLIDEIQKEFQETEEYQAEQQRKRIKKAYEAAKKQFAREYGVDAHEYDCCYNVFGELMDEQYLKQIIQRQKERRSSQESWRSTYSSWKSDSSSSRHDSAVTYTAEDGVILKQFYRSLSKLYHPDKNPDKDTTAEMQMLNRLKQDWGLGI